LMMIKTFITDAIRNTTWYMHVSRYLLVCRLETKGETYIVKSI
jgi:hypothetical protein